MRPQIVPLYAAVLALIYIALSVRVIRGRRSYKVGLGAGGLDDMERRIRAHGNFVEYVPFTLLLVVFDELQGLTPAAIHLFCLLLMCGRISHAWGVSRPEHHFSFRVGGMALTLTAMGLAAVVIPFLAVET